MPNRNYRAMSALVDALARAGVRHVCLSPGNRSAPLAFALAQHPDLEVWTHVDERSAGFFGLGIARATAAPVAVACTSGSAAANLLPAVVEAHYAGVGLILLTADRPPELRERAAGQTIDQLGLYGSHVRWAFDLGVPEDGAGGLRHVRAAGTRAVVEATGPPGDVVHLNLPMRDPLDPVPGDAGAWASDVATASVRIARSVPGAELAPVVERLARSRRPLVYAGPLDAPRDAARAVRRLADGLGAPVLAEPISNLRSAALEGCLVGGLEALLRDPEFAAEMRPDVVLRVGLPPTTRTAATWLDECGAELVVVDETARWSDPDCRATELVRGPTAAVCEALAAELSGNAAEVAWAERWTAAGRAARDALHASIERESEPFEGHVVRALGEVVPDDAWIHVGNSLAVRALDWFWPRDALPARVLANRGANGIDGFVSTVLGESVAGPPVVGLCGDLSFFHDAGGLVAGSRLGVRACFVVVNNGGGGIFDFLPAARAGEGYTEHFEKIFTTPLGLDLGAVATAYGARHTRVDRVSGIAPAVEEGLCARQTSVVEVVVDRSRSVAAHERAWAAARESRGGGPR